MTIFVSFSSATFLIFIIFAISKYKFNCVKKQVYEKGF